MSKNSRLLLLGISFFVFACSKKIISPVSTQPPKPSLSIEQIDFEYFHGKGRMTLRDANKEVEVKANIRIRKDSVIWMTFSVIGIQGGKALINKDSITIVNNKDNEVYVFEYPELSKRYNFEINYDVIQAVMLGNLIMPRKDNDEVQPVSSMYLLTQRAQTIEVLSYVNAASMKIEKVEMKEGNTNNALSLNYSNFQPVGNKIFPYNGTINLLYKGTAGLLNTTIIFEYSKAEVGDKELKFPFNIPKKYVRR